MTRPDVSVVIATRNRCRFLRQAVASALRQESIDVEVIVVDDGSEDGTADTMASIGDERLRVVRRETPAGAGAARNTAAGLAGAEWIAFLDDDDLFAPWRLRSQIDAMGDAGFGYCGQIVVDRERRPRGTLPAHRPVDLPARLREGSLIGGPSAVVVRKDLFDAVGGFSGRYRALDDWDLWLRLVDRSPAAVDPGLNVAYTVHSENMHLRDPFAIVRDYDRFEAANDGIHGGAGLIEWIADDNWAAGNRGHASALYALSALRYRRPAALAQAARAWLAERPPHVPLASPRWLTEYLLRSGG
jgi:glycosyltransferase involved in cell wall biosynthesis